MYLDANDLYGMALSQKLPMKDFKWIPVEEYLKEWKYRSKYKSKGYFLEADIEKFSESYMTGLHDWLHDWFNDLPLAPSLLRIFAVNLERKLKVLKS